MTDNIEAPCTCACTKSDISLQRANYYYNLLITNHLDLIEICYNIILLMDLYNWIIDWACGG